MPEIDPVLVQLKADVDRYNAQIKASTAMTDASLARIDKASTRMGQAASSAFGLMKGAAVGFVASLGVGAIIQATKAGLDYAASLGETAQQLGVTTKFMQEFRFAATQNGASVEEADNALGKFSVTLGKALDGQKSAVKAFSDLGISIDSLAGASDAQRFELVADAIAKIPDPARRSAAAFEIFGRGAKAILPTLESGAQGFRNLAQEAQRYGLVLSQDAIQQADAVADKIDVLNQVLNANISAAVANNANAIMGLVGALIQVVNWAGQATDYWQRWQIALNYRSARRVLALPDWATTPEQRAQAKKDMASAQGEIDAMDGRQRRRNAPSWAQGSIASISNLESRPKPIAVPRFGGGVPRISGGGSLPRIRSLSSTVEREVADPIADGMKRAIEGLDTSIDDFNERFRDGFEGGTDELIKSIDEAGERQMYWEEEAADLRAERIAMTADLFETLMTQGTHGFLNVFKQEGLRIIAMMAAQLLAGKSLAESFNTATGGSGLFGTLLGIGTSILTPGGGFGGGRASGGRVSAGTLYRVNEANMEFFRPDVSGQVIPMGRMNAARGGSGGGVVQRLSFDLRGAVMTQDLLDQMNAMAREAAIAGAQGGRALAERDANAKARVRL